MIENIARGISNIISNIIDFLIFWKDWDKLSTYLFLGLIGFIVVMVIILKKYSNQKPINPNSIKW